MWLWVFLVIALVGLVWHGILFFTVAKKAKLVAGVASPAVAKLIDLTKSVDARPVLEKPKLAINASLDDLVVRRMLFLRHRSARKAERERRLLDRLKQIDPTERRFTRAKRT